MNCWSWLPGFLRTGYNAVVSRYAFVVYPLAVKALDAELRVADASHFGHDLDKMAALINDNTRVVFIANADNPTGNSLGLQHKTFSCRYSVFCDCGAG